MMNVTRILNLENQLQSKKLANGEVVDLFLTKIMSLRDQMATKGIALKYEDLAGWCMRGLRPKFDGCLMALTTIRPTPLTFEEFNSMIMEAEIQLKVGSSTDKAYVTNVKGKDKVKDSNETLDKKKKMKCFHCGKKGCISKVWCKN